MPTTLTSRKATPPDKERAAIRWLAQTDLYAFVKHILHGDRPDNALDPDFHKPLCEYVQTTPYAVNLYMLPRGHFKTSLLTVGRNIQRLVNDPQTRILLASNKSENSEAMLSEIKGHLVNPIMLWLFPDILYPEPERQAERWTSSAITVRRKRRTKEATIEAIGVTGELTSKHYDHGTFDDVVGKENSQTKDLREGVTQFYRVAQSLFDPGSTQDVIGTPWHYADLYAWLLEQRDKHGMKLGAYLDYCWVSTEPEAPGATFVPHFGWVKPRFAKRFSIEALMEIRAVKGSAEFAAQYLINPVSADTAVFPREKIAIVPRREMPPPDGLWICMTVDPAISTKAWADYSAVAVVGFDAEGSMWILDLRRGKWAESELVHNIYDAMARTPNIRAIGFEAVGFQKIFRRLFTAEGERRGVFLPIVTLERDTKITKAVRIRALQPPWEGGEVHIAADCPALEDFLEEAERFRVDRESAHDDLLDAVVDSLQLRAKPMQTVRNDDAFMDPELTERQRFEWNLLQQKPGMDGSSLRAAWHIHQRNQRAEYEREAVAVGGVEDEFYT